MSLRQVPARGRLRTSTAGSFPIPGRLRRLAVGGCFRLTLCCLLGCSVLVGLQNPSQASLIVQVDTVDIVSNGSSAVTGYIEVYAKISAPTTVSNFAGLDITVQFQSPATAPDQNSEPTTIHPWFASSGGSTQLIGTYSASQPSYDAYLNSGGTALTNGEGFLAIPFTVPAGDFGTYSVTPTFAYLSDSNGNQIPVDSLSAGSITVSPSAVPEPSSLVLGLVTMLGAGFTWRKKLRRRPVASAPPTGCELVAGGRSPEEPPC